MTDTTKTALPEWARHAETAILHALTAAEADSYSDREQAAMEAQMTAWQRSVSAYIRWEREQQALAEAGE